ncbi:hypothetical protein HFP72_04690 [Nocardiopsis sp. ARC36]
MDRLNMVAEEAGRVVEEHAEEHAVEDGLLAEAMDDGKISKPLATARLKMARYEKADPEEITALQQVIKLYNEEAQAKKIAKEAQAALNLAILKKYGDLNLPDIKQLVLDDKWSAMVSDRIAGEVNALTLDLVVRIQELGERYAETVSALDAEMQKLEAKVTRHLADMGVVK